MITNYVRDPIFGDLIPCCWEDCEKPGQDHIRLVKHEGPRRDLVYIFCTERHKALYVNSHRSYGNLPVGWKGSKL